MAAEATSTPNPNSSSEYREERELAHGDAGVGDDLRRRGRWPACSAHSVALGCSKYSRRSLRPALSARSGPDARSRGGCPARSGRSRSPTRCFSRFVEGRNEATVSRRLSIRARAPTPRPTPARVGIDGPATRKVTITPSPVEDNPTDPVFFASANLSQSITRVSSSESWLLDLAFWISAHRIT